MSVKAAVRACREWLTKPCFVQSLVADLLGNAFPAEALQNRFVVGEGDLLPGDVA